MDLLLCGIWDSFVAEEMFEIIAYVLFKRVPEFVRLGGCTVSEDGDKEVAKLTACLHVRGLLETVDPLSIILQKSKG